MTAQFTECDHTEHAIGSVGYVGRTFTGTNNPAGRWEQCLLYTGRRPSVPPSSAVQGSVRTEGPAAGQKGARRLDRTKFEVMANDDAALEVWCFQCDDALHVGSAALVLAEIDRMVGEHKHRRHEDWCQSPHTTGTCGAADMIEEEQA